MGSQETKTRRQVVADLLRRVPGRRAHGVDREGRRWSVNFLALSGGVMALRQKARGACSYEVLVMDTAAEREVLDLAISALSGGDA